MDNEYEYRITVRDATRLDGARGKKQVWRPHVRTWGLSEANALHWSSCDIVRTFRRPAVIRRPGNCSPCPLSLRTWLLRGATRLNKSWYTALTRGIQEPWALGGAKFSIRLNFWATFRKNEQENFAGRWFCFRILPKNIGKFFLHFFDLVRISPPLRTPIVLTQKLWQNTSYLQLSGLNNWFYVVITIFAQHLNIWSPKLVEWRRLLPPPGDASGNSYWWLCGFEPFVATANP